MAKKDSDKKKHKNLEELHERQSYLKDENRQKAIQKRHDKGQRTARENIADLCDPDSFLEYGSLIVAAQRGRKSHQELIEDTPADGLVTGIGSVNGDLFSKEAAKCLVLSYDYTVLAGTQGGFNHKKTDRLLTIARKAKKPIVFFVEGGGGRPGDVDFTPISVGGLDLTTWVEFCRLSGKVPRIAIASGYCFAGNAAIAGCADVIIATENISIGMGGPAMVEGGGLGKFHPKEIGPAAMQTKNGVIDVLVKDEAEAVSITKKYLSYFQGDVKDWKCADQENLQSLIPENRKFAYDVLKIIHRLCDEDTVLELRKDFARNMITAFARIEGKSIGIIANSTKDLGGAINSDAADKASRFMQLCDAFGIPIVSLCDVPGFMVGPDCEKTGMIRHASRMFLVGASLQVPILTVVLRKAYGLGAMAMAGGSLHSSFFTVSWPTGEFGAMGLEGAVKLGFKKELDAQENAEEQEALYEKLVQGAYRKGKAINAAAALEFDEVIDPKDTRKWITNALESIPEEDYKMGSGRYVDAW
ncbi:MAG: acetyl-CoA carboxylase carboxyltransferase component [Saprospiraceae bacterium]|jgi:acetyl-CoA carboxylase carboxyltransferase component